MDVTPHMQKSGSAVEQFVQATVDAELDLCGARQDMNGQFSFAFLGTDPTGDRQSVLSQLVNIIGIKPDIGIDPHGFVKTIGQSIAGKLIASLINRRITLDSTYCVSTPFQFQQPCLTLRHDPPLKRNKHHALPEQRCAWSGLLDWVAGVGAQRNPGFLLCGTSNTPGLPSLRFVQPRPPCRRSHLSPLVAVGGETFGQNLCSVRRPAHNVGFGPIAIGRSRLFADIV